jgi:methylmalonyl-CoA mutase
MQKTALPFHATAPSEWIQQLHKELQNQTDLLVFKDHIEGLEIDLTTEHQSVGIPPKNNTQWKQVFQLEIEDEVSANKILLAALMQGAAGLLLSSSKNNCDWTKVLDQIEVAYIDCWIILTDAAQLQQFDQANLASKKPAIEFLFNEGEQANYFSAFDFQQIGATISTQLSVLLLDIHRDLETNNIKTKYFFELGLGTQYFLELSKIRAFRHLLSRLEAIHDIQIQYELIAKTGCANKSLKDPYTNLLRQATEALSAVTGGCDALCIQAYDQLSTEGTDDFSRRMALNIGNLIQEEAQMKNTDDPLKNARIVEALTTAIVKQAWESLIVADEFENLADFEPQIAQARERRIQKFKTGDQLMIGINQFENTFETKVKTWGPAPTAFGFPYLIYELV